MLFERAHNIFLRTRRAVCDRATEKRGSSSRRREWPSRDLVPEVTTTEWPTHNWGTTYPDKEKSGRLPSLPIEGLDFSTTEFVERRGGEKNSAQPCFRSLSIPPRRLCSQGTDTEKRCLYSIEHHRVLHVHLSPDDLGRWKDGSCGPSYRIKNNKASAPSYFVGIAS